MGERLRLEGGGSVVAKWCVDAVRKGGNVSMVGAYGPRGNHFPIGTAMSKGLTFRTSPCSVKRYMPHLLEHIRAGRIVANGLITHRMPLEEASEAYRIVSSNRDGCIKCVLLPASAA
jgi:threonine dehydrogenase-like Zn-dependent dehydrogenase